MIFIFDTPGITARQLAEDFLAMTNACHTQGSRFNVALSGGKTPQLWFSVLKEHYRERLHWECIHFYWCDERMVAAHSSDSNYGEARRRLFDEISISESNIHQIYGESEPEAEIKRYSKVIQTDLPANNGIPQFDLILLGMGSDGHTASIFHDRMDLFHSSRTAELVFHPETGQQRITLTGPVINNARHIAFHITGAAKARVLAKILNPAAESGYYPAAHVHPFSGAPDYYLDNEAAAELRKPHEQLRKL